MQSATPFDLSIDLLDLKLFEPIESQTSPDDRRSFLLVQRAVRMRRPDYVYLEIGSHLGGSLQPHLRDPRCRKIYSIDKRPLEQPDDRKEGFIYRYPGNSTARMMELLRGVAPEQMGKLTCFDSDAADLDRTAFADAPDLCLIDGEHTFRAALSDFCFCRSVLKSDGVVLFHDRLLLHRALNRIQADLDRERVRFRALPLPGQVYALLFGEGGGLDFREAGKLEAPEIKFLGEMRYYRLADAYERLVPAWCRALLRPLAARFRSRLLRDQASG